MNDLLDKLLTQGPLVQGGLALMIAGWLGYQLRALPARLWSFIRSWLTREIHIRDLHPHYEAWLTTLTEHALRPGGPRTLELRTRRDEDGEYLPTPHLAAGTDAFWARIRHKWCHVSVHRDEGNSRQQTLTPRFMITAQFLFCTRAALASIVEHVVTRATIVEHRQLVDIYNRHGMCTTVKIPKRDPATLCLPRGLFESLETRLRDFLGAQDQYERAGIPWRFGVLFSGPPGTGKTSLTHALASRLGLRIAVVTLADLETDQELVDVFRNIEGQALVLIEDIDCAFRLRDGQAAAGISFSGFLNCIDGVLAPHNGRILIMTTNHPERLDHALIRPGRVDLHTEITTLTRQDATDYADRIFPHIATRHDVVNEVMMLDHPTPATLINRLTKERWHAPSPTGRRFVTGAHVPTQTPVH